MKIPCSLLVSVLFVGCSVPNMAPTYSSASVKGSHWERAVFRFDGPAQMRLVVIGVDDKPLENSEFDRSFALKPGVHTISIMYSRVGKLGERLKETNWGVGKVTFTAAAKESYIVKGDDYHSASTAEVWVERLSDGTHVSDTIELLRNITNYGY